MKRVLCVLCMAFLFLSGCSGGQPTATNPGNQANNAPDLDNAPMIEIDQDKVSISDTIPSNSLVEGSNGISLSAAHPEESNAAIKVLSYPGKSLGYHYDLEWVYAAYFPKFDSLKAPGAGVICD